MYHNRYRKFISSPNSSRPHTRSKSPYFSSKNKAFSPAQAQTTPKYPSNNKNERPRTPLYCTAEPGSQEWRQYQADRLRAIRDLKEKRKETETLLNQYRYLTKSASSSDIATEDLDLNINVDINCNNVIDSTTIEEKNDGSARQRQGILVKRSQSSSPPLSSISHATSRPKQKTIKSKPKLKSTKDSIKWKEPLEIVETLSSTVQLKNSKSVKPITKIATNLRKNKKTLGVPKVFSDAKSRPLVIPSKQKLTSFEKPVKSTKSRLNIVQGFPSRTSYGIKKRGISLPREKTLFQEKSMVSLKTQKASLSSQRKRSLSMAPIVKKGNDDNNNNNYHPDSLSDFVTKVKESSEPPKFPDLQVCNVLPGTPDWDIYWEHFNSEIDSYNKAVEKYSRGMSEFSDELEEYSRKLKRETLDDLAFQAQLGLRPGDKKPPMLRKPIFPPLTMIGSYMIKRNIKSKDIASPISVHLTSYDHKTFRMEISINKSTSLSSGSIPVSNVEYMELVPNETYFVRADGKFNMLFVKIVLPQKYNSNDATTYKEEVQIGVPPGKSVFEDLSDLQMSSALLNKGRIIINGK